MNKYTSNSSKGCVLWVDLEYPKELRELYNDYPLVPDKIEIKREMLSDYQLKIADLYNISIGNVEKLVPYFFDKGKKCDSLWKLATLLKIRIEAKQKTKKHSVLEFNQSQWLKPYVEFKHKNE